MTPEPTILILEDERPQILALRATLQPLGRVVDFSDPQRALDYLQEQEVDAAVIDIHMPRMPLNGIEFIQAVRSFDKHLAVIIRTGDTSIEIAEHAIELQAFRRVIKSRTSVHELRDIMRDGIAETRTRRKTSRDAAATIGTARQLEETLGSVEDELSAAECYKAMLHSMRNQLTALAGFSEVWTVLANENKQLLLSDAAAENSRVVTRMINDLTAFLDGPFADSQTGYDKPPRADTNSTLAALRKRFSTATVWSAQQKTVEISALPQSMLVVATPLKLLTALRHTTEFCLQISSPGTPVTVTLKAHFTARIDDDAMQGNEPLLVFNRPTKAHSLGYVSFDWQAGPVEKSLEQIRQMFHACTDDPRVGNLHMIGLCLGQTGCSVTARISPTQQLSLQLFVPAAE